MFCVYYLWVIADRGSGEVGREVLEGESWRRSAVLLEMWGFSGGKKGLEGMEEGEKGERGMD